MRVVVTAPADRPWALASSAIVSTRWPASLAHFSGSAAPVKPMILLRVFTPVVMAVMPAALSVTWVSWL